MVAGLVWDLGPAEGLAWDFRPWGQAWGALHPSDAKVIAIATKGNHARYLGIRDRNPQFHLGSRHPSHMITPIRPTLGEEGLLARPIGRLFTVGVLGRAGSGFRVS
jgi:hypothetical protein